MGFDDNEVGRRKIGRRRVVFAVVGDAVVELYGMKGEMKPRC